MHRPSLKAHEYEAISLGFVSNRPWMILILFCVPYTLCDWAYRMFVVFHTVLLFAVSILSYSQTQPAPYTRGRGSGDLQYAELFGCSKWNKLAICVTTIYIARRALTCHLIGAQWYQSDNTSQGRITEWYQTIHYSASRKSCIIVAVKIMTHPKWVLILAFVEIWLMVWILACIGRDIYIVELVTDRHTITNHMICWCNLIGH